MFVGRRCLTAQAPPDYSGGGNAITRGVTGAVEAMPLWAGESVGGVTRAQPAAEILQELAEEAERLLRRWGSGEPRPPAGAEGQERRDRAGA